MPVNEANRLVSEMKTRGVIDATYNHSGYTPHFADEGPGAQDPRSDGGKPETPGPVLP